MPRADKAGLGTGIGDHLLLGIPMDELPVGSGQRGAGGSQVVHRLQEVSLALSVAALQDVDARRELKLQARVVAKMGQ